MGASSFGYNNPNDIDSWTGAQIVEDELDGMGYTANQYQNNSGFAAYNNMGSVSIWHWGHHGSPASLSCSRVVNGAMIYQHIKAEPYVENSPPGAGANTNNAIFYVNKLTRASLTDMLMAVMVGCQTSRYQLYHYPDPKYCLPHLLTAEKGVTTAIGFYNNVMYNSPATIWMDTFYSMLNVGQNVTQASDVAELAVWDEFGEYAGYDSIQIFGSASLKTEPARWGVVD